jgi:class 3 adenylate cyclase
MDVQLRIGIHRGPATSGMVCTRSPKFVICGSTMNLASRMESTCPPGCTQVTDAVHADAPKAPNYRWVRVMDMQVKGFGPMNTWVANHSERPHIF